MTLTIDLSADIEARLNETAARVGVDAAEYARRLIEQGLPGAPRPTSLQELFAKWDAEDATDDPAELEERRREWEEFRKSINENHPSDRVIYP